MPRFSALATPPDLLGVVELFCERKRSQGLAMLSRIRKIDGRTPGELEVGARFKDQWPIAKSGLGWDFDWEHRA